MIKKISISLSLALSFSFVQAQKTKDFEVKSPDGHVVITVQSGATISWSVQHDHQPILSASAISMQLDDGTILGKSPVISSAPVQQINTTLQTINYNKANVSDRYNQLTLNCRGDYGVIFRAYDDGVAYRFFTKKKQDVIVRNEGANFNFTEDHKAFIPIQWDYRGGKIFNSSFEALYHEIHLSAFPKDSLAFLPVLVDVGNGKKALIMEADLEDYPGMYLDLNTTGKGFKGVFASYPLEAELGGYNKFNYVPTKRADYIAKTKGTRNFPWRAVVIVDQDKKLLGNDMVQRLASPPRLSDVSWIVPGQVAWDWWNNWDITHVDFKAGINTATYKTYIDFAAANAMKYIVIDEGWSDLHDILKVSSSLDLKELVAYANQKHVGIILWATWYGILQKMNEAFPIYSAMGIKGFKIDFIDRDDQLAVASTYEIARKAAEFKLMVDYHGVYKPTGLQRTYPNVMGYEGVKGLENCKWANEDAPRYALSIPFIRMVSGPMDYTPGAMRNANQKNYRAVNDHPMSKGTRCQQLAMYVVYDAPLQMLADSPTEYKKEQECTDFITKVPTTFDETVPLEGSVGEYLALARRKGNTWFVGAMTNWSSRELTIDFSFLGDGDFRAEVIADGVNADRDGTDYKKESITVSSKDKLKIKLAPGGGWVARIEKK